MTSASILEPCKLPGYTARKVTQFKKEKAKVVYVQVGDSAITNRRWVLRQKSEVRKGMRRSEVRSQGCDSQIENSYIAFEGLVLLEISTPAEGLQQLKQKDKVRKS